jgi:hypothetical protein
MSIKRELFARDKSLFRLYVTPIFEEYLKDQSLYFLSREMRGTNINDVLDFRFVVCYNLHYNSLSGLIVFFFFK